MTVTAFLGCLEASTCPIHLDNGNTPSLATAKTRREAATIAMLVLWWNLINHGANYSRKPTMTSPRTAIIVIKMLDLFPRACA